MLKRKSAWWLLVVAILVVGLTLSAISCGGAAQAPTEEPKAEEPKVEEPVVPQAPKALHEALFAATPPGCTGCHTVGAVGVGAPGGTGIPGPASANDHTGRTSDVCKTCHQLSS